MGEHISINGRYTKLGTCEDLYYARFEQLRNLKQTEVKSIKGNGTLEDYLNPRNLFRYRFPFPDEDSISIGNFEDFGRGYPVAIYPDRAPGIHADLETWNHGLAYQGLTVKPLIYGGVLYYPCPQGKDFPKDDPHLKYTCQGNVKVVEIVQQKQVDGELWVIIRCPLCHSAKVKLDRDGAEELAECLGLGDHMAEEIKRRMMAGYRQPAQV